MDIFVVFLLIVSLISTESAKSAKVKRRLKILENQVNEMKSRVSSETGKLQIELREVSSMVVDMNSTVYQLEAMCRNNNKVNISQQTKPKDIQAAFQDTNQRLMAAFSDEQLKLREALDRIDQYVDEINQNNTRQTKLDIQTVKSEYKELKQIIENINATVELQEDIFSQYETTARDIKENITEELRKVINAQITDLKTTMKNKYEPLRECPDLWSRYGQFCYIFFNDRVVYSEAQRVCAGVGAEVVDMQSQGEVDFVHGLQTRVSSTWIGLTDLAEEGVYIWDRTNTEALFVHWAAGAPEPDREDFALDCVRMYSSDEWATAHCAWHYYFVCKKPL